MIARIKFAKYGSAKFIGHLDLLRYFQKAFRRAKLDLAYTQGFNPRQITTFASPLGVGLTSEGEYLDLTLNSSDSPSLMIEKINNVMADNIRVIGFTVLPDHSKNAMSVVAAADYIVSLKDAYDFLSKEEFQGKFREFLEKDSIKIKKKTKKSEIEMDLKPLIYESYFTDKLENNIYKETYENGLMIYLRLSTGSVNNIKPELVMETFCNYIGVDYNEYAFQVHRREIYASKSYKDTINFVPLDKMYD